MTIKEIQTQLETAVHPVAKALHKSDHFKVLIIGFRNGMVMKEHVAHAPSKLLVLEGTIEYVTEDSRHLLNKFDEMTIPVQLKHSVVALEDSLCLLTQG